MKIKENIFLIIIICIILIPSIYFNFDHNVYSYVDNKELTELDGLSKDNIESYIDDRIGLRKESIFTFNRINKVLFNYSSNPKYIYSDDGKEIYTKVDWMNASNSYYKSFSNATIRINDYLIDKDIPFYFVLTPSKAAIYSDNLPNYLNYTDKDALDCVQEISSGGVNSIDLFSVLKKESLNNRVFNKEYDVFHWNDYGLFIGSNALLSEIHKKFPNVTKNDKSDFNIYVIKGQDLLKKEYCVNEDITFYKLKEKYDDVSYDYLDKLELYEDFKEFKYIKTSHAEKPKILMFAGSYFISENRYEPLANQASELIMIHNYNNIFNIKKYVEMFNPDLVIFDACEYTLKEYYFSEYYMSQMDLS